MTMYYFTSVAAIRNVSEVLLKNDDVKEERMEMPKIYFPVKFSRVVKISD